MPNSPRMYFVRPVYAVMESKNCWMRWLLEACRMTPGQMLPDFRRSHVRTKQRPIMLAETTAKPNQPGSHVVAGEDDDGYMPQGPNYARENGGCSERKAFGQLRHEESTPTDFLS